MSTNNESNAINSYDKETESIFNDLMSKIKSKVNDGFTLTYICSVIIIHWKQIIYIFKGNLEPQIVIDRIIESTSFGNEIFNFFCAFILTYLILLLFNATRAILKATIIQILKIENEADQKIARENLINSLNVQIKEYQEKYNLELNLKNKLQEEYSNLSELFNSSVKQHEKITTKINNFNNIEFKKLNDLKFENLTLKEKGLLLSYIWLDFVRIIKKNNPHFNYSTDEIENTFSELFKDKYIDLVDNTRNYGKKPITELEIAIIKELTDAEILKYDDFLEKYQTKSEIIELLSNISNTIIEISKQQ